MQICLLVEVRFGPIPSGIKTEEDWGPISIVTSGGGCLSGMHKLLSGEPEAFKDWLRPFDGVWVGEGNPMEQKFRAMHIKD